MTTREFHSPLWDRGEAIDHEMLAFTIGDDWVSTSAVPWLMRAGFCARAS